MKSGGRYIRRVMPALLLLCLFGMGGGLHPFAAAPDDPDQVNITIHKVDNSSGTISSVANSGQVMDDFADLAGVAGAGFCMYDISALYYGLLDGTLTISTGDLVAPTSSPIALANKPNASEAYNQLVSLLKDKPESYFSTTLPSALPKFLVQPISLTDVSGNILTDDSGNPVTEVLTDDDGIATFANVSSRSVLNGISKYRVLAIVEVSPPAGKIVVESANTILALPVALAQEGSGDVGTGENIENRDIHIYPKNKFGEMWKTLVGLTHTITQMPVHIPEVTLNNSTESLLPDTSKETSDQADKAIYPISIGDLATYTIKFTLPSNYDMSQPFYLYDVLGMQATLTMADHTSMNMSDTIACLTSFSFYSLDSFVDDSNASIGVNQDGDIASAVSLLSGMYIENDPTNTQIDGVDADGETTTDETAADESATEEADTLTVGSFVEGTYDPRTNTFSQGQGHTGMDASGSPSHDFQIHEDVQMCVANLDQLGVRAGDSFTVTLTLLYVGGDDVDNPGQICDHECVNRAYLHIGDSILYDPSAHLQVGDIQFTKVDGQSGDEIAGATFELWAGNATATDALALSSDQGTTTIDTQNLTSIEQHRIPVYILSATGGPNGDQVVIRPAIGEELSKGSDGNYLDAHVADSFTAPIGGIWLYGLEANVSDAFASGELLATYGSGFYFLKEIQAPKGYIKPTSDAAITRFDMQPVAFQDPSSPPNTELVWAPIKNYRQGSLPLTGGSGTTYLLMIGIVILLIDLILIIARRRKEGGYEVG